MAAGGSAANVWKNNLLPFLLKQGRQASHGDNDDDMSGLAAGPREEQPQSAAAAAAWAPRPMELYAARVKGKTVIKTRTKNKRIKHRRSPSRCKHRAFGNGGRAPANAPVLRVGADCTGLNLGCVALEILGVRPDLIFASENDKATRAMTKHNFRIARGGMCPDIMGRDGATLAAVDIYTAGPPCQSWSSAGKKSGLGDARGCVFLRVLSTIKIVMPACFILENVMGLKTSHKETYARILYSLQRIKDPDGKLTYKVRTKVLNSLEVGGVPQSRQRVYIVGWKRALETQDFSWPDHIPPKPLKLLLKGHVAAEPQSMLDLSPHPQANVAAGLQNLITRHPAAARAFNFNVAAGTPVVLINTGSSPSHGGGGVFVDKSPCLTAAGCRHGGCWVANLNRHLLIEEMEALQGIPEGRLSWPSGTTRSKYRAMVGNSYTVGVIGRIALRLLKTIGKLPLAWRDAWADESQAWDLAAVGRGA